MNEPIISPWLIYWAGRIELIQVVCCVVGLVVTAFAVTAAMAVLTDDYEHDESVKALKILVPIVKLTYTIQYTGMIIVPVVAEKLRSGNDEKICCFR